jgi:flagellar biosynthetic protein FlhB
VSAEERTEQPTLKKLREAEKKGQVARSKEVHDAFQFAAALIALTWFGRVIVEGLSRQVVMGIEGMGRNAHIVITGGDFTRIAMEMGLVLVVLVGPIAAASIVGGVGSVAAQGGWVLSWEPLRFNPGKLSPISGLKRLGPSKAGLDLLRTLLIFSALAWIAYDLLQGMLQQSLTLGRVTAEQAGALTWQSMSMFLRRSLIVFVTIAGADLFLQKWRYRKGLMMTKQEIKEEMKTTEGNPQVKGRIRKAQRDMARRRMLADVPKATVVITNPTHIAVALEYSRQTMYAPKVLAIGGDLMAERIKKVAREHGVPIVENVALARALFANAEVGGSIPGDLFEAVAEVLAYLIKLKQLVL